MAKETEAKVNVDEPQDPGPDVSNAEIGQVSRLSTFSTVVENPNPNPDGVRPEPGPSAVEYLGNPKGDAKKSEVDAGSGPKAA